MAFKVTQQSDDVVKVEICERFDFSTQAEFRTTYESESPANSFILDFEKTKHMDSSALGMLLLLREYVGDIRKVKLVRCSNEIKKILEICHFQDIFDIS